MNDIVFLYEPSAADFDWVHLPQALALHDLYSNHPTGVQYWDGFIDPWKGEYPWISTYNLGHVVCINVWSEDGCTELYWPDAPTLVTYLEEVFQLHDY
jgi:hypothetical protein